MKQELMGSCDLFMGWPGALRQYTEGFLRRRRKVEETLDERVVRLGLAGRFAAAFPQTRPIHYGWFIGSPLDREQTDLLMTLMSDLAAHPRSDAYGVSEFQAALSLSRKAELELHVEYTPPGHVDFGIHTVHCHCPRCKARAPLAPWQKRYPEEPIDCHVCGYSYSPAETHSSERTFAFETVICALCQKMSSIELFSDDDKLRIEHHVLYRQFEAERRICNAIEDYRLRNPPRHPWKFPVEEEFDTPAADVVPQPEPDVPSAEDAAVLQFLHENRTFNVTTRNQFVSMRLEAWGPYADDRVVFCPKCHGALF
ncbi:MAG: hypothetical protein ACLQVD_18465 [Capsulimonadaceae bacterium]